MLDPENWDPLAEIRVAEQLLAPKYLDRFRCIGAECEDHCCALWSVFVDEASHQRLSEACQSPAQQERLERSVILTPEAPTYAKLAQDDQGTCVWLDGGLCAIHRDLGEEALPGSCATYPRSIAHVKSRCEVSGTLSCPEIARLCLLADDALDLVRMEWEQLPGHAAVTREVPRGESDYIRFFDALRDTIVMLLRLDPYAVEQQLSFVAYLANKLTPIFNCDSGPSDGIAFNTELRKAWQPEFAEQLDAQFRELDASAEGMLPLVTRSIASILRDVPAGRFRSVCGRAYDSYNQAIGKVEDHERDKSLWEEYRWRRTRVYQLQQRRFERYLRNYALNHWFKELYTRSANLTAHTQELVLRMAIVKFLLLGQPDINSGLDECSLDDSTLDRCAVEVFQTFSRAVDHNSGLLKSWAERLGDQGDSALPNLVCLIRF